MSARRETRPPVGDGQFARSTPVRNTSAVIFAWLCCVTVLGALLALAIGLAATTDFAPTPITPRPTDGGPPPLPPTCAAFLDVRADEQPRTRECGEPSTDGVLGECGAGGLCYAYAPDVVGADATSFDPVPAHITCAAPEQCSESGASCTCAIATCERTLLGATPETQTFQCVSEPPAHYCEALDTLPIEYQQFVSGCAAPAPGTCRCDAGVCETRYYRATQSHTEEPAADACAVPSAMCGGAADELRACSCSDIKVCQRLVQGEPAYFECRPPRFDATDDRFVAPGACALKTCPFGDELATGCADSFVLPNQIGASCDGAGNCVPASFITTGSCASAQCVGAAQGTPCTTCDCACTRRNDNQAEEPLAVGTCIDGPRLPTPAPTPLPTPPPTPVPTAACGSCPIDPGEFDALVANCGAQQGTCVVSLGAFCDLGTIDGETFLCAPRAGECASTGDTCFCAEPCACLARTGNLQLPEVLTCVPNS